MKKIPWFLFLFCCLVTAPSHAMSWGDGWHSLWYTQDQQGMRLLKEHPADAAKHFQNPLWQGIAYYRAKDFNKATAAFSHADNLINHYNRGNALAWSGQYEKALDAYHRALQLDPHFKEA